MPDLIGDKVTITKNGVELVAIEPNLGDHGEVIGGSIVCRDNFGNAAVALSGEGGQVASLAGGSILIRNGPLSMVNSKGTFRVRIFPGDELENEDGGTIILGAAGDIQAGAAGDHAAIVLNASKRSLVINGTDGKPMVVLGPEGNLVLGGNVEDGNLILRDKSGKMRVRLEATTQRLTLFDLNEKQVANLGGNGDLTLGGVVGGSGVDGDISLMDSSGNVRVRLGADEQRLLIMNSAGAQIVDLGPNGSLTLGGGTLNGELVVRNGQGESLVHIGGVHGNIVTTKGNLQRQRITERSRQVSANQHFDLFSLGQNGAFVVELAASFGFEVGSFFNGSYYQRWAVFTHQHAPKDHRFFSDSLGKTETSSSQSGAFWEAGQEPRFSEASGNVRLTLGALPFLAFKVPQVLSNATLCARALYGTLLDF